MSEVTKVVLISDTTVGNMKQILIDCQTWLDKDAKYAHPNSNVRKFRDNVNLVLQQIRSDEIKFLGKRFNVETTDQPSTPVMGGSSE